MMKYDDDADDSDDDDDTWINNALLNRTNLLKSYRSYSG